jgi:hypothetical protein
MSDSENMRLLASLGMRGSGAPVRSANNSESRLMPSTRAASPLEYTLPMIFLSLQMRRSMCRDKRIIDPASDNQPI